MRRSLSGVARSSNSALGLRRSIDVSTSRNPNIGLSAERQNEADRCAQRLVIGPGSACAAGWKISAGCPKCRASIAADDEMVRKRTSAAVARMA